MLVHIKELIKPGTVGKYAIPAFNTQNLETTMGLVRAAEKQNAPIIIQTSVGSIEYAGLEEIAKLIQTMAKKATVPIALHQDHCKDFNLIKKLIDVGYSSVMIDVSGLEYKENVKITKQVVAYAHKRGVWVQAEIGRLLGSEDWQSVKSGEDLMTDPDEALKFVQATGIDTLAVAVGSMHGIPVNPKVKKIMSTLVEHIDIPRLSAIHKKVNIPLVLHGASGVPDDQMRQAIGNGVVIFNIDTDLRVAFNKALRDNLNKNPEIYDPRKILGPATNALQQMAETKIKLLKTNGKAKK